MFIKIQKTSPARKIFGAYMGYLREKAGLNQAEFGQRFKKSRAEVWKLENGKGGLWNRDMIGYLDTFAPAERGIEVFHGDLMALVFKYEIGEITFEYFTNAMREALGERLT